jgi:two-component system cell cycle response regulator
MQGSAVILRGVHALGGTPQATLFAPGLVELLVICSINLSAIATAFGLSLATNLKLSQESERLALFDPLTSLPNRRLFEARLEEAESRTGDGRSAMALVYCDLDNFKRINDTMGHAAGDQVLRAVADRLRGVLDKSVCLARVGGDEFVILIEDAGTRSQVSSLVDSLRRAVEQELEVAGQTISPKISCGLALYPDDVGSVSDLTRLADAAMYAMKQHGRPMAEDRQASLGA